MEDARQFLTEAGIDVDAMAPQVNDKFFSAFIRARKPKRRCGPGCCDAVAIGERLIMAEHYNVLFSAPATRHGPSWPRRSSTQRQRPFHSLQRRQPSDRAAAPRSAPADRIGRHLRPRGSARSRGTNSRGPDAPKLDFVFTVCDNAANEQCPFWPGQPMTAHWGIADPAAVKGTPEEIARAFREAFTVLDRRIGLFLSLPLATLENMAIQRARSTQMAARKEPR